MPPEPRAPQTPQTPKASSSRPSRLKGAACATLLLTGLLISGAATTVAYLSHPLGPWDHQAYDHIHLFGTIGLTCALITAPITALAVARRWLRPWWLVPCVVLTAAAWGRVTLFLPAR
ncbi:hypothetical protein AQJ67_21720 [Streptomyces caeruleatus]|uniref:Uncharacterized protein n=1 Tax=Streptomyces caeruleatus TaxID=661399 RepID=A0A101U1Y5_9ACTN|nr:hypothetical protein AQJ67_21720 [Streptomyces caeruleatus]